MIPNDLAGWTLDSLRTLLTGGYYEQERFDYKVALPHSKNEPDKVGLRKDCCAFANSAGGFLVFGVRDERQLPVDDRLVGVAKTVDFPALFGDYPRHCTPSVRWEFRNPPIEVPNGNVVHVVWIPPGPLMPHSIVDAGDGMLFTKRTNKGNEKMSYDEVRSAFLGYHERRTRLVLLMAELNNLHTDALSHIVSESIRSTAVVPVPVEAAIVEQVLIDTYPMLADEQNLVAELMRVRARARALNGNIRAILPLVHMPLSNKWDLIRQHNEKTALIASELAGAAANARSLLEVFLAR